MTGPRFLPYGRQTLEPDDVAAVVAALESDFLTTGPAVAGFEEALAEATDCAHAVCVANGTAALHAACAVADLGAGDEVVVPALTFLATANCARYVGAEPIFADVDPDTGLLTREALEAALTARTRAIIPVHLTGAAVAMSGLREVARAAGAAVIEDAAHALGGCDDGRPIGACAHSDMTIFSFHPVKQVTSAEGGAVTTRDAELAWKLRTFRNHGMTRDPDRLEADSPGPWHYEQQSLGFNYRLSDVHAALGRSQLRKLARFVDRRRALAARYDGALADLPLVTPVTGAKAAVASAYHLYSVLIDFDAAGLSRARVMEALREAGIGTQVHYIPVPMQPYYRARGWNPEDFPGAMRYFRRTLSLPLFPAMVESDVDRVVEALAGALRGASS